MRGITIVLILACAAPAYAIEPYQAQEIQPYQAQPIQRQRAKTIETYQADSIQPYQAETIQPYQSETVKPYQAETIQSHQADSVKPYQSDTVRAHEAASPSSTAGSVPTAVIQQRDVRTLQPAPPTPEPKKPSAKDLAQRAKTLVGVWQTNIPGAVYTTPSGLTGYDVLHVSSGAAAGLLRINANGTYSWNSYGGKKGKWIVSSNPEYPITIIDTVENRRWAVGYSGSKGVLYIWDGSIWYEGRKAVAKK